MAKIHSHHEVCLLVLLAHSPIPSLRLLLRHNNHHQGTTQMCTGRALKKSRRRATNIRIRALRCLVARDCSFPTPDMLYADTVTAYTVTPPASLHQLVGLISTSWVSFLFCGDHETTGSVTPTRWMAASMSFGFVLIPPPTLRRTYLMRLDAPQFGQLVA